MGMCFGIILKIPSTKTHHKSQAFLHNLPCFFGGRGRYFLVFFSSFIGMLASILRLEPGRVPHCIFPFPVPHQGHRRPERLGRSHRGARGALARAHLRRVGFPGFSPQLKGRVYIWVFPKIGVPQNGWFIMENPIKMDDLGAPLYLETPICLETETFCLQIGCFNWIIPNHYIKNGCFTMNPFKAGCLGYQVVYIRFVPQPRFQSTPG